MTSFNTALHPRLGALALALLLAACNNDTGSTTLPGTGDDDHDHDEHEGSGRLVFTQAAGNNSRVYVYDLEEQNTLGDFALTYPATALYASPGGRYTVILQRDDDQVQFLDGGIRQHDDHVDTDDPTLLPFLLTGVKPTHYRSNDGLAALFFDGDHDSGLSAQFQLFNDASLANGGVIANQELAAHHGIAEPIDGWVLSSHISGTGTSADSVALYELHGDHFHGEGTLPSACPGLHGGASNHTYSVFGCEDGALVAELHGDHFHDHKIDVAERLAVVLGNADLDTFAAFAYPGYNLYSLDPAAATAEPVDWRVGVAADAEPLAYGLDPHGEHLLILDNSGTLHVIDTDDWDHHGSLAVLSAVPEAGSPAPALAFSGDGHEVFISDPEAQAILRVDLDSLEVHTEVSDLTFAPLGLAWTGVAGEEHDDEHDHDEDDHDHDH